MISWRPASALVLFFFLPVGGCTSSTDPGQVDLTGEWCTLASIGGDGQAIPEKVFMGPRLQQDGSQVEGPGQVKRSDSETLWPSRFQGTVSDGRVVLDLTPNNPDHEDAPVAHLDLEIRGEHDLVGTVTGDPGLAGDITLVRFGSRCTE